VVVSSVPPSGQDVRTGVVLGVASRPLPTGRFLIRLSGRVPADEGVQAFALDGTLLLEQPPDSPRAAVGDVERLDVTIRTNRSPDSSLAPAGSVVLTALRRDGTGLIVQATTPELVLVSAFDAAPVFGSFKTAEQGKASLGVASVLLRLRIDGDRVAGEMYLSSRPTLPTDLPFAAEYAAQVTGRR